MAATTEPHVVTALEAKRAELLGLIRDHERTAERLRRELAHLDATLRLFKPDAAPLEEVEPKRTAARTYFRRGVLAREALAAVREAEHPLSARQIALRVVAHHGLDPRDAPLVNTLTKSVNKALRRYDGAVAGEPGPGRTVLWSAAR